MSREEGDCPAQNELLLPKIFIVCCRKLSFLRKNSDLLNILTLSICQMSRLIEGEIIKILYAKYLIACGISDIKGH